MKVSGAIIQNKNIRKHTEHVFDATYKGRSIYITSDHGHGEPRYEHLTRFDITVIHIESGMYDVNTYEDCHTMHDAIRVALFGAMLLPEQNCK